MSSKVNLTERLRRKQQSITDRELVKQQRQERLREKKIRRQAFERSILKESTPR